MSQHESCESWLIGRALKNSSNLPSSVRFESPTLEHRYRNALQNGFTGQVDASDFRRKRWRCCTEVWNPEFTVQICSITSTCFFVAVLFREVRRSSSLCTLTSASCFPSIYSHVPRISYLSRLPPGTSVVYVNNAAHGSGWGFQGSSLV